MTPKAEKMSHGKAANIGKRRLAGRPKVASDESRRDLIREITRRLFLERGYQGVTMADVATDAHVSLRTVYRLFPSKLQLFSALVDHHRRSMIALPGDYDDLPVEIALERIFWVDLDQDSERQRAELMQMFISEGQRFPELLSVSHERGPEYSRKLLAEWLERQMASGRIWTADATITADMLMGIAFGIFAPKPSGVPQWITYEDRALYLRTCFAMIVDGLRPRD